MTPEMFRKLAALGLSTDQMAGVLEIFEADAETRKEKARARVQKWRERQKNETQRNVTEHNETLRDDLRGGDARGEDNLQTTEISGKGKKKENSAAAPRGDLADFKAELSIILDPERVEALVAVRRKKGATMTANTGRLLVAAIQRCHLPAPEVADEMALRNWTSVKPDWLESRTTPQRQATAPPSAQDFNAILDAIQGKPHVSQHTGPAFDGSYERTDRGSAPNLVQLHAVSSGR